MNPLRATKYRTRYRLVCLLAVGWPNVPHPAPWGAWRLPRTTRVSATWGF